MPKCVKCMKYFHPDWMVEQTIRGDDVVICCFCLTDKDSLTVTDENDKVVESVTKEQANKRYLQYLEDLSRKPKIAEILTKAKEKQGK